MFNSNKSPRIASTGKPSQSHNSLFFNSMGDTGNSAGNVTTNSNPIPSFSHPAYNNNINNNPASFGFASSSVGGPFTPGANGNSLGAIEDAPPTSSVSDIMASPEKASMRRAFQETAGIGLGSRKPGTGISSGSGRSFQNPSTTTFQPATYATFMASPLSYKNPATPLVEDSNADEEIVAASAAAAATSVSTPYSYSHHQVAQQQQNSPYVLIYGIPHGLTLTKLLHLISDFGVILRYWQQEKSSNFMMIQFNSSDAARKAILGLGYKLIMGNNILGAVSLPSVQHRIPGASEFMKTSSTPATSGSGLYDSPASSIIATNMKMDISPAPSHPNALKSNLLYPEIPTTSKPFATAIATSAAASSNGIGANVAMSMASPISPSIAYPVTPFHPSSLHRNSSFETPIQRNTTMNNISSTNENTRNPHLFSPTVLKPSGNASISSASGKENTIVGKALDFIFGW